MFKSLVFITLFVYCSASAGGYGSGSGMAAGMGLSMGGMSDMGSANGGYGAQMKMSGGNADSYGSGSQGGYAHQGGPIQAAVQSRHSVEIRPVPTQYQQIQPQIIEVDSGDMPIILNFNSRSSRLMVQQSHTPAGPGEVQSTQSEDEPHRLVHEVLKPVIQEVREVITPYRRIIQEVRPVVEEIQTIVAKGEKRRTEDPYQTQSGASAMSTGGYGSGAGLSMMGMTAMGGQMMGATDGGYGSGRSNSMALSMGGSNGGGYGGLPMASSTKSYKS